MPVGSPFALGLVLGNLERLFGQRVSLVADRAEDARRINGADKHSTDERIAAIATKYTSTGEHAKIPLMICVASGRTSFQGKIQLMDLDGKVIHGDFELAVSDHAHLGVVGVLASSGVS